MRANPIPSSFAEVPSSNVDFIAAMKRPLHSPAGSSSEFSFVSEVGLILLMAERQMAFQPVGNMPVGVFEEVLCLLVSPENGGCLSSLPLLNSDPLRSIFSICG